MAIEVRTLKEAVAPIIWLNCIFCMGIFEIPTYRPRFRLSVAYVVSVSIVYIFVLYQGIIIFCGIFGSKNLVFDFVWANNIMVATSAIILFWRKSENISNVIKRCSMVDVTLEALGIEKQYKKLYRQNIGVIIFWITGMTLLIGMHSIFVYSDFEIIDSFYVNVSFCIPVMVNSIVDATFAALLRCVQTKFQSTNILLSNVTQCANETSVFKIPDEHDKTCIAIVRAHYKNHKDKILHLVGTLRHLHLEITRITRQINGSFCTQILLELSVHFTIVTACSYYLYSFLSGHAVDFTKEKCVALVIWACVYGLKIIVVNDLCTKITQEAYKTGEIVQSFEGSSLDDDLREEIRQFTQQIMLNSLNITAAGFFEINNCLTGKFFATVTTYVVILIQIRTPL